MNVVFLYIIVIVVSIVLSNAKKKTTPKNGGQDAQAKQASGAQTAKPAQMLPQQQARRAAPIQPTVSVSRHDHGGMFEGSLHADDTGEGKDIHDHGFTHEVETPSMRSDAELNASIAAAESGEQTEAGGLNLCFDGQSIVNAVVMNEILRRKTAKM